MATYTVIGLWIDNELVVAGVADGDVPMVDNGPDASERDYQRYAETFEATGPDEAEQLAIAASEDE